MKAIIFSSLLFIQTLSFLNRTNQEIVASNEDKFLDISPFYFNFGGSITPKPSKKEKGGEDALLVSKYILGVADGVGSWVLRGIDPRDYSYRLMLNSNIYFYSYPIAYADDPQNLIVLSDRTNQHKGSSTMVLCTLSGNKLYSANVGDSGYMILTPTLKTRPKNEGTSIIYDITHKSVPQQHRFNFPFQLGPFGDDPTEVTENNSHNIGYGTIVLVYSDGVGDNLFNEEFRMIVNLYIFELKQNYGVKLREFVPFFDSFELAERIEKESFRKSIDTSNVTPFRIEALNWGYTGTGGKSDDISIAVGMIMEKEKNINDIESVSYTHLTLPTTPYV